MKTAQQWKACYLEPAFQAQYTYQGKDLGAACSGKGTSFLLWSPFADKITLNLYRDGGKGEPFLQQPMDREEKGVWAFRTEKNLHGIYYDYEIRIDGETKRTADPYAKACGINGRRSMAVDLSLTNPIGWEEDHAPEQPAERIIYEVHVKEFSWDPAGGFPSEYRGKYKAFLCEDTTLNAEGKHPTGIPYLKELGVTHIQLMPVFDYGSVDEAGDPADFNWGYDPVNYNVPEGSYATDAARGEVRIREMKEMIQSLHKNGFRVIMDVVYNHTYSLDSWLQRTVPWYYYRLHEDGSVSNGSACGNDIASERPMCASYLFNSVLYWAEEYHIDGFRFDLMGLLDTDLMNRIRTALDLRFGRGEKLVYGEPWAAGKTAMDPGFTQALKANFGKLPPDIGMFCDNTRDVIKGAALKPEEPGFINGRPGLEEEILDSVSAWCGGKAIPVKAPSQILNYVSAHDNQTLYDKLASTLEKGADIRKACRLAAGIYMTCQGSLFFLSGEEFARTKNGLDNTYDAPVSLNRLDWTKSLQERGLVEYYKGLIALRKQLPGLCDKSPNAVQRIFGRWNKPGAVGFFVDNRAEGRSCRWETLCIVYNSKSTPERLTLPRGTWELLADGESSFLWKSPVRAGANIAAAPGSILILGKTAADEKNCPADLFSGR